MGFYGNRNDYDCEDRCRPHKDECYKPEKKDKCRKETKCCFPMKCYKKHHHHCPKYDPCNSYPESYHEECEEEFVCCIEF